MYTLAKDLACLAGIFYITATIATGKNCICGEFIFKSMNK